ncbi:hypothetical protein RB653_007474 [Dictyostelium firmibasis]|uniref:Deoxycytidine triphosphate deaminase n=1 Tax=Dictyostelium firmibasis TaxID=79012 RepID=A0AAN7U3Q6_9MYCE
MNEPINNNKDEFSLLSDKAILRHMGNGTVIISPFIRENLSTSSYDVTLGPYYYRETEPESGAGVYNPYSEEMVSRVWGTFKKAETAGEWSARSGIKLENIADDELIIWIKPKETILAHTNEFIGGNKTVTTMMKARSSMGRNFIEICKCAGMGDIGYVSRWTMEITNNSRNYSIPLVVGRRLAQIVFFNTDGIDNKPYESKGKYQVSSNLEELKQTWNPSFMLPKMYKDKEILNRSITYSPTEYFFEGK